MDRQLEAQLWNDTQEEREYSQEDLLKIIDALLNDFEKFARHKFERSKDIYFDPDMDESPNFSIWIHSYKQQSPPLTTKWLTKIGADIGIENEDSHCPIKWLAVMGGGKKPVLNSPKKVFMAYINMFVFRLNEEKRIYLKDNKSMIWFNFEKSFDKPAQWSCTGWYEDIYGEWDYHFSSRI